MAKFKSIFRLEIIIFFLVSINNTSALYEDQVGKIDWKKSFIGRTKFSYLDNKRAIVATEENAIASIYLKNGQIQWRQLMENPEQQQIQFMQVENSDIYTVSGDEKCWFVRNWDAGSGTLLSEWTLHTEKAANSFWLLKKSFYHIIAVKNSHIEMTKYGVATGENRGKTTKISAPWVSNECVLTHSTFTCLLNVGPIINLYYIDLLTDGDANVKSFKENKNVLFQEDINDFALFPFDDVRPAVLLVGDTGARLIYLDENPEWQPFDLIPNAVGVKNDNKYDLYQIVPNFQNPERFLAVTITNIESGEIERTIEIDYPRGLGAPVILNVNNRAGGHDVLLQSSDNALSLLRLPEGQILWTREEALSNIVEATFLELPMSDLDASIEKEFKSTSGDILSMFIHRITTQARQLSNILFERQLITQNSLVRDDFGLHKMIVVATSIGKLFGIDSLTGAIIWSYRLSHIKPFKVLGKEKLLLFVQRTARYPPLPAQCVLLAEDANTGNGIYFQFDPITGLPSKNIERLDYRINQAMLLNYEDENFLKPLIIHSKDDTVHVYPESGRQLLAQHHDRIYLYNVDTQNSLIRGLNFIDAYHLEETWKVNLGPSKILSVMTKPVNERVHSQGRVLPNRNVYFKYVNPNLIAVATQSEDPIYKHVVSVYLIDGVTGFIFYSNTHKRCRQPVHVIHSENWLVYSYYSERFRRTEMVAVELYEGHTQSNSTVFSSHAISQLPDIQSQAYILPATPLTTTVTLTERGITHKFLLLALSNGRVVEIPWALLQPRSEKTPCGPEDNCIPYMPEIPLYPENTINYNQTLERVSGIEVAPARLESTCHVLVHGMDIFYTRVAPSKGFDMLKEDFDYNLIVIVLTTLIVASYVTKQLASRKAIKQLWK